jgi:hypothetical protein
MIWNNVVSGRIKAAIILIGVYGVIFGLGEVAVGGLILSGVAAPVDITSALVAAIIIALGIATGVSIYGLLAVKEWGRKLTIALFVVQIVAGVAAFIDRASAGDEATLLQGGVVLEVVVILFLMKGTTRRLFRRSRSTSTSPLPPGEG